MQRLQRERRVAHPAEPVVPVALAARRLGQRRRRRRHRRPRRHVGQALDRQRRALNRLAPAMIGQPRIREPVAPEPRRRRQPRVGLVHGLRRVQLLGPRQRAVDLLALAQRVPRPDPVPLDAQRRSSTAPSRPLRSHPRCGGHPPPASTAPACGRSRTPGRRSTPPAPNRPGTAPCGRAGGRRPRRSGGRVCGVTSSSPRRGPMVNASRTKIQPPGVFHVVTRVFVPGSYTRPDGTLIPNGPRRNKPPLAVEQVAEDARSVKPRHAQPIDRPVWRHQRTGVAIGQERVVGDRRKRRRGGSALLLAGALSACRRSGHLSSPLGRTWPSSRSSRPCS